MLTCDKALMDRASADHGRIKGAAIRSFVEWYASTRGTRLVEIARELPPELRSCFDLEHPSLGILASEWFPATTIHRVLDGLTEGLSKQEREELAQSGAEATIAAMMTGVQRVIFTKLMTPSTFVTVANLAFHANYDAGRVLNKALGPKRHFGTVEGWTAHHPFLCRLNVGAKLCIYRHMRCRNVAIERCFCVTNGDDVCGSILTWE
jgi:hypothetical protein